MRLGSQPSLESSSPIPNRPSSPGTIADWVVARCTAPDFPPDFPDTDVDIIFSTEDDDVRGHPVTELTHLVLWNTAERATARFGPEGCRRLLTLVDAALEARRRYLSMAETARIIALRAHLVQNLGYPEEGPTREAADQFREASDRLAHDSRYCEWSRHFAWRSANLYVELQECNDAVSLLRRALRGPAQWATEGLYYNCATRLWMLPEQLRTEILEDVRDDLILAWGGVPTGRLKPEKPRLPENADPFTDHVLPTGSTTDRFALCTMLLAPHSDSYVTEVYGQEARYLVATVPGLSEDVRLSPLLDFLRDFPSPEARPTYDWDSDIEDIKQLRSASQLREATRRGRKLLERRHDSVEFARLALWVAPAIGESDSVENEIGLLQEALVRLGGESSREALREVAKVRTQLGFTLWQCYKYEEALECVSQAVDAACRAADASLLVRALGRKTRILWDLGRHEGTSARDSIVYLLASVHKQPDWLGELSPKRSPRRAHTSRDRQPDTAISRIWSILKQPSASASPQDSLHAAIEAAAEAGSDEDVLGLTRVWVEILKRCALSGHTFTLDHLVALGEVLTRLPPLRAARVRRELLGELCKCDVSRHSQLDELSADDGPELRRALAAVDRIVRFLRQLLPSRVASEYAQEWVDTLRNLGHPGNKRRVARHYRTALAQAYVAGAFRDPHEALAMLDHVKTFAVNANEDGEADGAEGGSGQSEPLTAQDLEERGPVDETELDPQRLLDWLSETDSAVVDFFLGPSSGSFAVVATSQDARVIPMDTSSRDLKDLLFRLQRATRPLMTVDDREQRKYPTRSEAIALLLKAAKERDSSQTATEALREGQHVFRELGEALFTAELLDPLCQCSGTVYLAPHMALYGLPLHALPSALGTPLFADHRVLYIPKSAALIAARPGPHRPTSGHYLCLNDEDPDWVHSIANFYPEVCQLVGEENRWQEEGDSLTRLSHLAAHRAGIFFCHGYVNTRNPALTRLALHNGVRITCADIARFPRSFENTEVHLYACGSGQVHVRGVHADAGLASAFLRKGARSVLSCLWSPWAEDAARFALAYHGARESDHSIAQSFASAVGQSVPTDLEDFARWLQYAGCVVHGSDSLD